MVLQKRIPLVGGDEYDALTSARHIYCYLAKSKACKYIKNKYNRRIRRLHREEIKEYLDDNRS